MCFTATMANPHFALVVTDTAITRHFADGSHEHGTTEKLYQLKNGWLAGTGNATVFRAGAEALAGVDARDLSAVSAALAAVEPESTAAAMASDPEGDLSLDRFILCRDDGTDLHAMRLRPNGEVAETARNQTLVTCGSGVSVEEREAAYADLGRGIKEAVDLPDLIVAIARTQARLADAATGGISRELHAGVLVRAMAGASFHMAANVDDIMAGNVRFQRVPFGARIWPDADSTLLEAQT